MSISFQERHRRMDAYRMIGLRRFLQLTDRIIGRSSSITVSSHNGMSAPAFTTGALISIEEEYLRTVYTQRGGSIRIDKRNLAVLKGLNYHELGHVMYSPRNTDLIYKRCKESSTFRMLWNIFEDARIERMFGIEYPIAVSYFNIAVNRIIVNGHTPAWFVWFLIVGRRVNLDNPALVRNYRDYLINEHRMNTGNPSEGPYFATLLDKYTELVDEYMRVVFPRDSTRAIDIINRAESVWHEINALLGRDGSGGNGYPTDLQSMSNDGKQPSTKRQKELAEKIAQEQQESAEAGEGDSDADGNGKAPGDASEADSDGQGDGDDDSSPSNTGGGAGKHDPDSQVAQSQREIDANQAWNDLIREIMDSEQMQRDLDSSIETIESEIKNAREMTAGSGRASLSSSHSVTVNARLTARDIRKQFERLRVELEPSWERRIAHGKINVGAWLTSEMNEDANVDIFDRFDEGELDRSDGEIYFSVDISGSMAPQGEAVREVSWIIKQACDLINWSCTVEGWSSEVTMLYPLSSTADPRMYREPSITGGTDPSETLNHALGVLSQSHAKTRLFLMFTDGDVAASTVSSSQRKLQTMRQAGIITGMAVQSVNGSSVYYDSAVRNFGYCTDFIEQVHGVSDMVGIVRGMINASMRKHHVG